MTVAQALDDATRRLVAAGIDRDDARLEAEVLLAEAHSTDRTHLLARLRGEADAAAMRRFGVMLSRRAAREPLAYIIGGCEFYGLRIECSSAALIPRPETEMLVDIALDEAHAQPSVRVADVGTGTGTVAVAIAKNVPAATIVATDLSSDALALARRNAAAHGVEDTIEFIETDLLPAGTFDVIVANLPYVSEAEWAALAPEIREHEPRGALVAGPSGTEIIERLLDAAPAHLAVNGVLAAEIGSTQGAALTAYARARIPAASVDVLRDLAGLDRVLVVRVHE